MTTDQADDFLGSRWLDTSDNRFVRTTHYGGNGVWCEREDDGSTFHCCQEDFFIWKRFKPA